MPATPVDAGERCPTNGTELRHDPFFHDDGYGGKRVRFITPDGKIYWGQISRKTACRFIAELAEWVGRGE